MRLKIPLLAILLFAALLPGLAEGAVIREIRLAQHEDFTRAVIELNNKTTYRVINASRDKGYLTVEFDGITSSVSEVKATDRERLVTHTAIAVGKTDSKARLHMKTPSTVRVEDFTLENPARVVVDLYPASSISTEWRQRIVIDPGHGGKDPGAVGKLGSRTIQEKDVVLGVARRLAALLRQDVRFDVSLTRDRDVYVSLTDRTRLASSYKGDLFVSIHANAVGGGSALTAKGFEIWTWNRSSNHSAAAKAVAKLENREFGITKENTSILTSMMEDALESQALVSRRLAASVHTSLVQDAYFRSNDRGIDRARFKVLENYAMPSILVELGFITHPDEVRLLDNASFQQKYAQYLYQGIIRYYEQTDPAFPRIVQTARAGSAK